MLTETEFPKLPTGAPQPGVLFGKDKGELYLHQLEQLRHEMSTAMLAISGNSLRVFEESLWRQQVLCISLKRLLQSLQVATLDNGAMARIHSATEALYRLNQTYADLVQQSGRSTDLLYGLCRSYNDVALSPISTSVLPSYSLEA